MCGVCGSVCGGGVSLWVCGVWISLWGITVVGIWGVYAYGTVVYRYECSVIWWPEQCLLGLSDSDEYIT